MKSTGNENQDLNMQPASFQKRFLASALDLIASGFLSLILAGIAMLVTGSSIVLIPLFILFFVLTYFANAFLYQMRTGRTFGKYVLGLKVCYPNYKIDTRNEDIIKREMAKIFTLVTVGYSFFSKYKEEEIIAFHDEYSKTVVLNLPEEHEEYLYEYHYETYFHSQSEEEEYKKAKEEADMLHKQQLEEEKLLKEQEKQAKKQQKKQEKSGKGVQEQPMTPPPVPSQPIIMNANEGQEQVNPYMDYAQDNPVSPEFIHSQLTQTAVPNMYPTQPVDTHQQTADMNYPVPPPMETPQPQDGTGIHIVGNYDFLSDNKTEEEKKGLGKISKLFGSKNDKKAEQQPSNQQEQSVEYYDHKMSDLVQDDTYLPSQNIFSEYFKGWSLKTDYVQKGNQYATAKKK